MPTYQITKGGCGLECLDYLRLLLPAAPPGYLKQLLRKVRVRANGAAAGPHTRLQQGVLLELPDSGRLDELARSAEPLLLDILHEDDLMIVVDKPSGLTVHRSKGHEGDNLLERVQRRARALGQHFQIAPVHRLDLQTSGPVLFGKGHQAISALGKTFMTDGVEKLYLGLVRGELPDHGRLETPVFAKERWKEASTRFRVLERLDRYLLLELTLESGRTHQIRRQLADRGVPLAGDRRYRGPCEAQLNRLFLHCHRLRFRDPFCGALLSFESPLPPALRDFLRLLA